MRPGSAFGGNEIAHGLQHAPDLVLWLYLPRSSGGPMDQQHNRWLDVVWVLPLPHAHRYPSRERSVGLWARRRLQLLVSKPSFETGSHSQQWHDTVLDLMLEYSSISCSKLAIYEDQRWVSRHHARSFRTQISKGRNQKGDRREA